MLELIIPEIEFFDEELQQFMKTEAVTLKLEHSLISISKWESKWCKPFLGKAEKTKEETIDYIRCMTLNKNPDPYVYYNLSDSEFNKISEYINAPMTATWFNEYQTPRNSRDVITSEIIYYWMIVHNIPMECQKWHLNRLITLIRVCGIKNQPPKKRGRKEMLTHRRALNEARRSQFNTKG